MVIKHFGLPGVEISNFCGRALIMSRKSSSKPSMIARLTPVTDLVMDLKGSSCLSCSWLQTSEMACLVLKTIVKLKEILT